MSTLFTFQEVGNKKISAINDPWGQTLDDMSGIQIPDELPTLSTARINDWDESTMKYLLEALSHLKTQIPKFPPRPILDIKEVDFNNKISDVINDFTNYVNRTNMETHLKNQIDIANHNIIKQQQHFTSPPPVPPVPPYMMMMPSYYLPPYCMQPPPPPHPPPPPTSTSTP